jgi:4'-phosphopantetheinyl transferase
MQAAEAEAVILYYSDLRGQWPEASGRALLKSLPYGKRLQVAARREQSKATLAGVALALRALEHVAGRTIAPAEIRFPDGGKPSLEGGPQFSISHSGPWVGCAVLAQGLIGFDIEQGSGERVISWAATEAALKACGAGIAEASAVKLSGERAVCRGRMLYAHAVELFPGAAACVMTSCPARALNAYALPLPELFAPWSVSTDTARP